MDSKGKASGLWTQNFVLLVAHSDAQYWLKSS